MKKYVHHLKQKPEHIRKRLALGATVGATALIAIVWGVTLVGNGSLAIGAGKSVIADSNTVQDNSIPTFKSSVNQLLGAVGASSGTTSAPALTIVDKQQNGTPAPVAPNPNTATRLSF